ncbi:MAG: helix-turn-helix transcriptional regulator [Oscillospiraceae bacterium]|nr:helix-turn-helix transcriptional regulator [Oscillospiraceae bacterium]
MNGGSRLELSEKLQELRCNRGLTQEELAEALYVSRTAVSKWESGRGTPSIDSLKELSRFFSVSIDELLSGEALVQIAENENRSNLRSVCELLFGIVDLLSVCLVLLPLYPDPSAGQVYAVSLFSYTQAGTVSRLLHWLLSLGLVGLGGAKVLLTQLKIERPQRAITRVSMALHIIVVLFLAMVREPYAITMAFLLLVIKGALLLKITQIDGGKRS